MTIEQINAADALISRRESIGDMIAGLAEVYEICFFAIGNTSLYSDRRVSGYLQDIHKEVIKTAQEAAISVLTNKRDEITAELKALGVEE